ncbi:peptidyl-dipeptidase Dcp [Mucilaginibacter paludis]|uniref:Dipeptidyl carboxypeptidase n=1 Tax=Mucilaginibacter paludis DSM 18603 TaxID=714943 RepID=H1Y3M6_9SPHI|nr:peptidyl-dipeptidase Dcp [Mucilaginibacter paludis]EHQ30288.1 peptidase M3A and M3B thimet/oligopeptidase F [Mucilaginibacter paludis DSM 18603]
MKYLFLPVLTMLTVSAGSAFGQTTPASGLDPANPFYLPSALPFQAPAFDKIKNEDFRPAMEAGMKEQLAEIQKIADNKAAPTLANTLVAMEKSGRLLNRVNAVLNVYTGANTNPVLQKVEQDEAPKLAANNDAIYLNTKLFKRVEAIYQQREQLKLDAESKRLVEFYYQNFVLAGARLSEPDKETLKKLNQEEASLRAKFGSQLLAGTKAGGLVINDKAELDGLSDAAIAAAAQNAKAANLEGKWLLTLQNTTQQPDLQSLKNRATRHKLFEASWTRTEKGDANDTRATISRIAQIRAQKAKLLGFASYAAWKLQNQMAKTPEAVEAFLDKLVPAATAKAKQEAADIQALIDQQNGGFKVEAWDWNFYAEQVRKARYDLDESQIKPYLEINNVLQKGIFYAANLLYGINFKERKDLPVYQEDVRVFDVFDKDGKQLALFYCDYYKRDNKRGGAWMSNMVGQSYLLGTIPVIYNVCNFTKPAPGQPALISFSEMTTMFHEFGHALHGMFSSQKYPGLSGTSTARDFVEFPSQFNEHWATDPKVISHFALHYKTGEPMPQALINKMKSAATFNQGYAFTEILAAHNLDLKWHSLPPDAPLQDVDQFEAGALHQTGLDLPQVPPRYRSSYFSHIWGSGYAAGYYAYSWTEMLAHDAFAWFEEHGGLTRENGQRFRDMILSRGNTIELGKMYRDFRGHDADIKPLLISRGLVTK